MRQKVSDYIADYLAEKGIREVFTVTGGSAMHLNDSFGHHPVLHCTYNHHEQAAAMAAEAYARIDNVPAVVCVTSGPGATNAITGVVCGWMDSIPMIVISGQVRYATTIQASNLKLRTRGIQEFDIIGSVQNMTKYCEMISRPEKIRYCLDKAIYLSMNGRPGPCWLDVPLDVQGAIIDTDLLEGFDIPEEDDSLDELLIDSILEKVNHAERPLLYAGHGVRLSGGHADFLCLVDRLNIPVVTGGSSVDVIESAHPMFVGRTGISGDRAGNFAVQNCDLFISIGGRLGYSQTGFNYKAWTKNAVRIINDIDGEEIKKDSLVPNIGVNCDAKLFIKSLLDKIEKPLKTKEKWLEQCRKWKLKYPVVLPKHYSQKEPNIYSFFKEMSMRLSDDYVLVTSVGTSRVVGSQATVIQRGGRYITNAATAAMGYGLPAAIGVSKAAPEKKVVLVTGEGSLQMNIQELQTIIQNKFPIIIFVMNNQGYHSIRMSQKNHFHTSLVGVGTGEDGLSFPDLQKIADAYGFDYKRCDLMSEMISCIEWAINHETACICEMMLSIEQVVEPKVTSKVLENGMIISPAIEDMFPFLPEEEMKANMANW